MTYSIFNMEGFTLKVNFVETSLISFLWAPVQLQLGNLLLNNGRVGDFTALQAMIV